MTRRKIAELVFQCLHTPPQRDAVELFARLEPRDLKRLLLHLDQTGLAGYLLHHLIEHNLYSLLTPQLQDELDGRLQENRARSDDMFQEFARVITAFERAQVNYAVMKGFSLIPDYTPAICLRHHNDLDIQIDAASMQAADRALQNLGYGLESQHPSGETKFERQLWAAVSGVGRYLRSPERQSNRAPSAVLGMPSPGRS